MKKIGCFVLIAAMSPATAADATAYSPAWVARIQASLEQVSDEAIQCARTSDAAKSLPAGFDGTTNLSLNFNADGTPKDIVVTASSGNEGIDAADVACYHTAPHLAALGEALRPVHSIVVVSPWKLLLQP